MALNLTDILRQYTTIDKIVHGISVSTDFVAEDLLTRGMERRSSGLWVAKDEVGVSPYASCVGVSPYASYAFNYGSSWPWEEPQANGPLVEEPFEVNMAEALVGWRAWKMKDKQIGSLNQDFQWPVCAAADSKCRKSSWPGGNHKICTVCPSEHCTCGFYAVNDREDIPVHEDDDSAIIGEVYGWGRYVRGDYGWRAQYAYPKALYLTESQGKYTEQLKQYRVPIFIERPLLAYSPLEDGFNEYRQNEENWNSGAFAEPGPDQDSETAT